MICGDPTPSPDLSRRQRDRKGRPDAAFTLVEMLLALAATGIIAAVVVSMMAASAYGSDSKHDMRTLVVKDRTLLGRMTLAVRTSRKILALGDNDLVLWKADTDDSGAPNLSELELVELDPTTHEIWCYQPPATLSGGDTAYDLTDDFISITGALKGSSDFPGELWATGVTAWSLSANNSDVQSATLLSMRVTLEAGDMTDTMIAAAALRNIGD